MSLPTIAQPSFWKSLVPKPFRSSSNKPAKTAPQPKAWNPATFFIVMFLLIGSNAINMISMQRDFAAFTRRADVKTALLREVVEKLQRGEHVDVERALGTGDSKAEKEWEEGIQNGACEPAREKKREADAGPFLALREIEREDIMQGQRKKKKETGATSQPATGTEASESTTTKMHTSDGGSFF